MYIGNFLLLFAHVINYWPKENLCCSFNNPSKSGGTYISIFRTILRAVRFAILKYKMVKSLYEKTK